MPLLSDLGISKVFTKNRILFLLFVLFWVPNCGIINVLPDAMLVEITWANIISSTCEQLKMFHKWSKYIYMCFLRLYHLLEKMYLIILISNGT